MHWRGVNFQYHHASCLDSYVGTITRLRNRPLEDGKKAMFLCRSLVRSQRHMVEAYAEAKAVFSPYIASA